MLAVLLIALAPAPFWNEQTASFVAYDGTGRDAVVTTSDHKRFTISKSILIGSLSLSFVVNSDMIFDRKFKVKTRGNRIVGMTLVPKNP
jgi:hypothetical protein